MIPSNIWKINSYIWASTLAVWGYLCYLQPSAAAVTMVLISAFVLTYCLYRVDL